MRRRPEAVEMSTPLWMLVHENTYFYDVLMLQFTQELDLADSGHVEAVLELPYLDFLYSHLFTGGYLSSYESGR